MSPCCEAGVSGSSIPAAAAVSSVPPSSTDCGVPPSVAGGGVVGVSLSKGSGGCCLLLWNTLALGLSPVVSGGVFTGTYSKKIKTPYNFTGLLSLSPEKETTVQRTGICTGTYNKNSNCGKIKMRTHQCQVQNISSCLGTSLSHADKY